ncbi:hypothetical protein [Natranaerofaba carboxydovora]|uniref:hypothetical protein n=1 Tax=Natranaerofaba carboxydovora TaxID=2742683 RepID=UPI001F12B2CF|nr:hypothetical protein [Natranaerofaba carboxydovora]UMZ72543.1 hypothetical protein ACONDI_00064 [Natranaerofaba carboxydovora]
MSTTESKEFLLKEFEKLDEEGQRKILDYVKRLSSAKGDTNSKTPKSLRGALRKYKNKDLRQKENGAWASAVKEKHENS